MFAGLVAGVLLGACSRSDGTQTADESTARDSAAIRVSSPDAAQVAIQAPEPVKKNIKSVSDGDANPKVLDSDMDDLRNHHLLIPINGVRWSDLRDTFHESRGDHIHNALDIMAARGTAILSVDDGAVLKVHNSVAGGLTVSRPIPAGDSYTCMGISIRFIRSCAKVAR